MGLQKTNEVDVISFNENDSVVTLGIIDSLDWENPEEHLLLLQEKLNLYLSFVESGEIYSIYKVVDGSAFEIKVYFKDKFPQTCSVFLERVSDIIKAAGFKFNYEVSLNISNNDKI